jgi:membrane protein implicated in regulation of membrane protease activity
MSQRFSTHHVVDGPDPVRDVLWYRLVIRIEVAAIFILAVAITVAPQAVLDWLAVAAISARDFSAIYRSAVALVGLFFAGAAAMGIWLLVRPRRGVSTASPKSIGDSALSTAGKDIAS